MLERLRFFVRPRPRSSAALRFILFTALIDMISIGLIIPVLPVWVGHFTHSQAEQALYFGMITFSFSIANFFGSPLLGALSDSVGRRPVLLIGFCGLAINFFMTALSTTITVLILARLIGGVMQSNLSVANAYVADITPADQRARQFGLLGAMFGVGFILGPVVGGLLGAFSIHLPFYVAGSLALLNLAYGYFVLPESLPVERRSVFHWKNANPLTSLRALKNNNGVGPLLVVVAASGLAQFMLYTTWVLYTSFKFGWGPLENGWSLAAVGFVSALIQGVLLGRLLQRFSPIRLTLFGLLSSTIAYVLWGLATESWMMFAIIFFNLFGSCVSATLQSIISSSVDAKSQGKTLGLVSGINSLMAVMAPLIGAPLLGLVSDLPKGDWRLGTPFYFCAALQALALVLAILHFRGSHQLTHSSQVKDPPHG